MISVSSPPDRSLLGRARDADRSSAEKKATAFPPGSDQKNPANTRARRILIAIFLVCLAPVLASYAAFYFWRPTASVAHGELLHPPQQVDWNAYGSGAATALRGKWVLTVASIGCNQQCEALLYQTRQIRTALDKDSPRVARAWIALQGVPQSRPDFSSTQQDLHVLSEPAASPLVRYPNQVLLVDPQGRLMMRFDPALEPKYILKDLERLLKYSSLGNRE